jgi:ABC-2 type transport system permease protein
MLKNLQDLWLVFRRYLVKALTSPIFMLVTLSQPVLYVVLFAPLLKSVAELRGFPPGGAYNVFIPGLLVQLSLFATTSAGWSLIAELKAGVTERLRVTPASRVALLLGRALASVVTLILQAIAIIVVSLPFGLRVQPLDVALVLLLIGLIGLMMASASYAIALVIRNADTFGGIAFSITLPLLLLSGVLLPMSLAPKWLQAIAALNPLSYAVDAARAVFNSHLADASVVKGFVVISVLAAVALAAAVRSFSRALA